GSVRLTVGAASVAAAVAVTLGPAASGTIAGDVLLPPSDDSTPRSRVALSATFALAPAADPWNATVEWQTLTWEGSPVGEPGSLHGRRVVTPGAEPIGVGLARELDGGVLPDSATVTARAGLAGETLEVRALRVETLGGALNARGTADLATLGVVAELE